MLNHRLWSSVGAWVSFSILFIVFAKGQDSFFQKTDRGIEVHVDNASVELAVVTPTAFRLSISYQGKLTASGSTFLAPETNTDRTMGQVIHQDGLVGVASAAGKLLIDPRTGRWTLEDPEGGILIPLSELAKATPTATQETGQGTGLDLTLAKKPGSSLQIYGSGNGSPTLQQTTGNTHLADGVAVVPYYWSASGYAVLAITADDNAPASWTTAADRSSLTWHFPGTCANLYLMPAATLKAAAQANAQLTGYSPVPPRWTFGYLQSRWGWTDRAYIEDTLKQFRTLQIPVDAFIIDFEWYTRQPDYSVPPAGTPGFTDFGWNPVLFPQPTEQLANYREQGIHFVGIRKPRIANSETLAFLKERGWLPDRPVTTDNYHQRDANFASSDFRAWYAEQSQPLLQTGHIGGWWNDEGEATFTNYYDWNEAELEAWQKVTPDKRFWTLNRAFSPGLQRLGAAAWTGDIHAKWNIFAQVSTDLLNWNVAGMPYCTCDIGGYKAETTPELLSRWMEAGTFFPIMRAHSAHHLVPHFPWLFGPEAQAAITKAIDLRYRLIPYYYSLAYETHETGVPMMRPLMMEFPDDHKVANLSDQWTVGSGLMVAPIDQQGATARSVYLPQDRWFPFESTAALEGDQTINASAKLDEIPIYVRAGTILPLGPIVQSTDELPGGPLDLQIYPGKDATFTLVEDDGESIEYLKGDFRKTTFTWNEANRELSWATEGNYEGPHSFKQMTISLFDLSGRKKITASLDRQGYVHIPST